MCSPRKAGVTGTGAVSSAGTDSESQALGLRAGWSLSEALGSGLEEFANEIGCRVASIEHKDELPSTLRRSPENAQQTWSKAHDLAVETYGEGERAHRTAFAALEHTHQKVGDHWEHGRASMSKGELGDTLRKASDRQSRQARERGTS